MKTMTKQQAAVAEHLEILSLQATDVEADFQMGHISKEEWEQEEEAMKTINNTMMRFYFKNDYEKCICGWYHMKENQYV